MAAVADGKNPYNRFEAGAPKKRIESGMIIAPFYTK